VTRARLTPLVPCLAVALAACGGSSGEDRPARGDGTPVVQQQINGPIPSPDGRPDIELYEPLTEEDYTNAKRVAARAAQRAVTYRRGATAGEVADSIGPSAAGQDALANAIAPVIESGMRSAGEVVYPQMSGVTPTSFGAMVVVRQTLQDAEGEKRSVTRVLDVRLRRSGGPWSLERIASVGGAREQRPDSLSEAAEAILDNDNIVLPDSARWDIFRGEVDEMLLRALDEAAAERELSVAVLSSGHPPNVWQTDKVSAHTDGFAADIWAVDGRAVIRQRERGSPAFELASTLVAGGAQQLGSPWVLGPGAPRSFTDAVHQDHLHVQQAPVR